MDIGKALNYPFKDPNWVTKMVWLSVFTLLSTVLVGVPFVVGYTVLAVRGVIKGEENLPEWTGNWEMIFTEGLKYSAVMLVIMVIGTGVSTLSIGLLTFLWNIASAIVSMLTLAKLAATGNMNDLLDFNWYVEFTKENWQNMLTVFIFSIAGAFIAGFGIVACVVGVFFTMYVYSMSCSHLIAQMYVAGGGVVAKKV